MVSQDEEKDNEVVSTWGEPVTGPEYLSHHVLLEAIGGYEPQRGANVAGHRFRLFPRRRRGVLNVLVCIVEATSCEMLVFC